MNLSLIIGFDIGIKILVQEKYNEFLKYLSKELWKIEKEFYEK